MYKSPVQESKMNPHTGSNLHSASTSHFRSVNANSHSKTDIHLKDYNVAISQQGNNMNVDIVKKSNL